MIFARSIVRRLSVLLVSAGLLLVNASSISTSGITVVSYTQVLSGTTSTYSFPPSNPCGAQPRTIRLTSDGSFRITMLRSGPYRGYYWITPLQRGTFEIQPNRSSEARYAGTFELQTDTNSGRNGEITFFLHLVGRGSDGTSLNTRLMEHLSVSYDKVTISMASPAFLATPRACS